MVRRHSSRSGTTRRISTVPALNHDSLHSVACEQSGVRFQREADVGRRHGRTLRNLFRTSQIPRLASNTSSEARSGQLETFTVTSMLPERPNYGAWSKRHGRSGSPGSTWSLTSRHRPGEPVVAPYADAARSRTSSVEFDKGGQKPGSGHSRETRDAAYARRSRHRQALKRRRILRGDPAGVVIYGQRRHADLHRETRLANIGFRGNVPREGDGVDGRGAIAVPTPGHGAFRRSHDRRADHGRRARLG